MRILKARTIFFIIWILILGFSGISFSNNGPRHCIITIKNIQLEKDTGDWITVIEPDHQVDLANQEALVSFFNNGRRVPPGSYRNFKIIFDSRETGEKYQIYGLRNFSNLLKVASHSFISVSFELNLMGTLRDSGVRRATVVVDEQTLTIPGESIRMVFYEGLESRNFPR